MISVYIQTIKRIGTMIAMMLTLSILSSCFKDYTDDFLFTEAMIEFDTATWESNAPDKTYPILGAYEKGSGEHTFQVNLIGKQLDADQTLQYRVVPEETTAVEGMHYALPDNGSFVFEANNSTARLGIDILDFPAGSGVVTVVLELVGNDQVKVSENYKRLGISISLTGPPSDGYPLYEQLGPDSYFNSIYIDPLNPDLPADIRQRIEESAANLAAYADGSRRLQSLYIYFDEDDLVRVTAQYYGGGGNSLTASPYAQWTYRLELDAEGVGTFEFVEANGNGTAQRANFHPILGDYLEAHSFKVDWVDPDIATPARPEVQLGGLFRTDDPDSYLIGPLATLSANGSIRPFPSSPAMHELFSDGDGGYFTTLYIDPDAPQQSAAFQARWQEGKAYIESLAGRQLHKMLFYFNPDFNFQDVQVVNQYYSSSGGRFLGQIRFQWRVDYEGRVQPFAFIYQNGNGNATRAPEIIDNFLMVTQFSMSRTGDRIRFTSTVDPSVYFEGELGNHALNINEFWPE
ncbi:DUF4843 domain-containing protein [Sinomicrobium soli]|uniref:DUF4843 domain-containing protein n=1 Tax=Sinomicrobium sp. N-1-3-6 TaxID=2219864 RepID=UPI0013752B09|nr:DUF4843 domain-containing protein [Sinomicrobium sp. N-1-3-6]